MLALPRLCVIWFGKERNGACRSVGFSRRGLASWPWHWLVRCDIMVTAVGLDFVGL